MEKLIQRDNLSNDWSYLAGLSWGEIWAGVDAASYTELVEWSDPECLDRPVPLPTLARQYLPDVVQEADEHGEDFEMEAFALGFFEAGSSARTSPPHSQGSPCGHPGPAADGESPADNLLLVSPILPSFPVWARIGQSPNTRYGREV